MPPSSKPSKPGNGSIRWTMCSSHGGPARVGRLLRDLGIHAQKHGVKLPFTANTPYINTIHPRRRVPYPGSREIERRIKSLVRWNAMAMVVQRQQASTTASAATSRRSPRPRRCTKSASTTSSAAAANGYDGDSIYFQGHALAGHLRARVPRRPPHRRASRELPPRAAAGRRPVVVSASLADARLLGVPDRLDGPRPDHGHLPGALQPLPRGPRPRSRATDAKVWAFLGDGETDEPESLGAITLASREKLDNLIFVINCNLQRLDGPVRGNGKIIQELEGDLPRRRLERHQGHLGRRLGPAAREGRRRPARQADGRSRRRRVSEIRRRARRLHPQALLRQVSASCSSWSSTSPTSSSRSSRRGGHDPEKVYAAYKAATETKGKPTVILAKTIKGYGLGEAGEGRNITHKQKKLNEEELREFRTRFGIPISDEEVAKAPFYRPPDDSAEMKYLRERRKALGGPVPSAASDRASRRCTPNSATSSRNSTRAPASARRRRRWCSSGMLSKLLRDKQIGKYIVPIVPDESRTFGMEALFRQFGIYSHVGQLYEPVDSRQLLYYKEAKDGQILEEGITEAGSMSSFIAAGTAYATHGVNMIPFFIYLFDVRLPADRRPDLGRRRHARKGFILGGTAGRTTLNGEGLQHQDGHSHVLALPVPNCQSYDPAFAYEIAVIIDDGIKRMYDDQRRHLLLPDRDERELRASADAGGLEGRHPQGHVRLQADQQAEGEAAGAILRQRHHPAPRRSRRSRSSRRSTASAPTSGASRATSTCIATATRASAGTGCTRRQAARAVRHAG